MPARVNAASKRDAGAPVTLDEIMEIEDALDVVWDDLSASAQAIIDKQGVAYTDIEARFGNEYREW